MRPQECGWWVKVTGATERQNGLFNFFSINYFNLAKTKLSSSSQICLRLSWLFEFMWLESADDGWRLPMQKHNGLFRFNVRINSIFYSFLILLKNIKTENISPGHYYDCMHGCHLETLWSMSSAFMAPGLAGSLLLFSYKMTQFQVAWKM